VATATILEARLAAANKTAKRKPKKVDNSRKKCSACRWNVHTIGSYDVASEVIGCSHPSFFHPIRDDYTPIEYARMESKKCGPKGLLWEAKTPRKLDEIKPCPICSIVVGFVFLGVVAAIWYGWG
jgi:hypothetical protein